MQPSDTARHALTTLLEHAVEQGVSPGFQWACAHLQDRFIVEGCAGRLSHEADAPRVDAATVYDLASVTKVLTALTVARRVEAGRLGWQDTLGDVVPEALGGMCWEALLSHRAGLPAWAPLYERIGDRVGPEAWRLALDTLATLPRTAHATPTPAVYSDLGYILAGSGLETLSGASLAELVAAEVTGPLGLTEALRFRGVGSQWRDPSVAPTERCPWRGRVMQGEVHDENAYALGGVAGHAGMFGTARSLAVLGLAALDALAGQSAWLSQATMTAMVAPRPGGTHRLGWDGRSAEGSSAGTRMGPRAFGHLGFTGTSLWCDPDAGVVVALVSNRVHPTRDNLGIRALRPAFHDAVMAAFLGFGVGA